MFDQIKNKFPVDDETWNRYVGYFKQIKVPAKTALLKEGEVSRKLFLIERGCIRAWFNNDGKEVTFQFFFEGGTVASIESFRKRTASPVALETLEPAVLWWIHKKDLDKIMEEIKEVPHLRDLLFDALFERTYQYMKHFFSSIKDSPAKRYQNLIAEKPQIIRRVPQHYIASYLGITTVHLSRIKSKLAKEPSSPRI